MKKQLFLIDCGESTFERLIKSEKLENSEKTITKKK